MYTLQNKHLLPMEYGFLHRNDRSVFMGKACFTLTTPQDAGRGLHSSIKPAQALGLGLGWIFEIRCRVT